jgi:diamine N-acetyltransferase
VAVNELYISFSRGNEMIELKEITWDNFWDVINLKSAETQKHYLQTNAVFMAMAYVNLKFNYPDACFAIYHGETVVGFSKIVFVPKDEEPYDFSEDTYLIDAMMIDERHQGKGYGKAALNQILSFIRTKPWGNSHCIKLSCYDENIAAIKLYEKSGFVKTDRFVRGKKGLRLYILQEAKPTV